MFLKNYKKGGHELFKLIIVVFSFGLLMGLPGFRIVFEVFSSITKFMCELIFGLIKIMIRIIEILV